MKTNPRADVHAILRSLRRRLIVREFLDALAWAALAASAALLVAEGIARFTHHAPVIEARGLPAVGALITALAAGLALARRRTLSAVAALIDRRGGTKDRLATALALSDRARHAAPLDDLARAECGAFLARTDLRPLIPLHAPRAGMWLVVPLTALALLRLDFAIERRAARLEATRARAAIAGTIEQIERLARSARQAQERTRDEELKKLAEQLAASAGRLRAQANRDEAQKAALRELSALEEMMRELQRQPSPADEMKELARALAPLPGMEDVLKALNEHNLAEARRALERTRQEQKPGTPQPGEEQIEKALREALQNLAERRQLSQALQRLAEQLQQHGGSPSQQALQQLAQMLEQAQKNGGSQSDGSNQRQMTLKELIAALENAKFGEAPGQQQPGTGQPGDGQPVIVQSFTPPDAGSPQQPGDAQRPSGQPGSERDFGTTATPFGERTAPQDKGGELTLKGQLGQGETLSMMLPSAGDQSRAARRYKDLYDAASAAAQDAVQQENIPLGSRFLIKRYFESIRPQE